MRSDTPSLKLAGSLSSAGGNYITLILDRQHDRSQYLTLSLPVSRKKSTAKNLGVGRPLDAVLFRVEEVPLIIGKGL